MSNKELRKALIVRYIVFLKRRWYYLILVLIYFLLGFLSEVEMIKNKDDTPYIVMAGVFAIIGMISYSITEITRHEKCHYIVPFTYDERKRYYLIGILLNFTILLVVSLLFIGVSIVIDHDYANIVMQVFAMIGLPYMLVSSFQKINMFKGKKKKDNPLTVYISYVVGVLLGIAITIMLLRLDYFAKQREVMNALIIGINLIAAVRTWYATREIMKGDTDYENVKINQLKALKKLM
ncbi:hypothetical protein [Anaerosporobacter faecicola]|uniref:hypothetical protein n=1 Tax=Anaerosporobacter faecicola TaxID=2718714 RepID=UPI00143AAB03|nr:hypothetical protein [Anaerosporobacter faecicola]